ncbi:MAG: hypothetical protein K1W22_05400 [Lachnospiraceae bacterium]
MMKYKNVLLAMTACMLILSAGAGSAWAYFTTYTEARGGYAIRLGSQSTVTETLDSWTKHVTVTNDAASGPVYIRAKAFAGSQYELAYYSANGKWTLGDDGFYYYSDIVEAGGSTEGLDIRIDNVPAEVKDGDSFNVVVVYESTPVIYKDGEATADWNAELITGSTEEGGAAE